ncbi:hypothetical protein XENOCAPTIV_025551 [Xenoophorus captivus]|uniref:Uncharacterized protein n=1 Tax=Xenoophorus captivus TaxID=1517983 RepID=A0ABV0RJ54_9TELE
MPEPANQKLSDALSLISLAKRLQGHTRVGDEHWSDRKSRDRGGNSRKMYRSIGDLSISAAVSARGGRGRSWEKEEESRDSMTEQSDSETSSSSNRESPSEFSLSDRSSPTSSATAETEISESDSEMERDKSQGEEEVVTDTNEESVSETEDEGAESSRKRSKGTLLSSMSSAAPLSLIFCPSQSASSTKKNMKPSSPIFSSRLAKHFKKLDRMAATLEERVPMNTPETLEGGGRNTLSTFQSCRRAASAAETSSFSNTDNKMLNVLNTRKSSVSLGSTSTNNTGPESEVSKPDVLPAALGITEQPESASERDGPTEGELESKVDGNSNVEAVTEEPLDCPSDKTQSDEEELWMGPWNSLHIPMTKL